MQPYREIRAGYDRDTITVYQAYRDEIADAAIANQRFVAPFSFNRMTWIKPSFLWMMERSNWGRKSQQERTLAIRIKRTGFEKALSLGVLTSFEQATHEQIDLWRTQFNSAVIHVQWDPERSIYGKKQQHRSIQIGISRSMVREFVEEWIVEIKDLSPLVQKIRRHCDEGEFDRAKKLLPNEKVYQVEESTRSRLGMME